MSIQMTAISDLGKVLIIQDLEARITLLKICVNCNTFLIISEVIGMFMSLLA